MSTTGIDSTLITQAARKILRPIGMHQKGRSRTWLGDHGWWMEVVEFQPSDWATGSYLNVSCMWLWNVKAYISFDVGRIAEMDLHRFENEEQFEQVAELLAQKAEERVLHYRGLFPTASAVSNHYLSTPPADSFWPSFNAAVAHGLSGRANESLTLLKRWAGQMDHSIEWQKNADLDAQYLAAVVQDAKQFHKIIVDRVTQSRALHKLPPTDIDFERADLIMTGSKR